MARRPPTSTYEVRATFDAPLDFVYKWCTDYSSKDGRYDGEGYARLILRRSARRVIYEDLEETQLGWRWSRHVVRLSPPNRWHSESVGSHRDIALEYRLSMIPGNRTQLTLRARRRPSGIGGRNPSKTKWERSIAANWRSFGRVLERDYRRANSRRAPK